MDEYLRAGHTHQRGYQARHEVVAVGEGVRGRGDLVGAPHAVLDELDQAAGEREAVERGLGQEAVESGDSAPGEGGELPAPAGQVHRQPRQDVGVSFAPALDVPGPGDHLHEVDQVGEVPVAAARLDDPLVVLRLHQLALEELAGAVLVEVDARPARLHRHDERVHLRVSRVYGIVDVPGAELVEAKVNRRPVTGGVGGQLVGGDAGVARGEVVDERAGGRTVGNL